jgi:secretion/DNA translocation related TadE-like protein
MSDVPLARARAPCDERGSATIWAVSILLLVSAGVGWALLWVAAESTRHSAERAADSAALAAASAAIHSLAMRDDADPCTAASKAAATARAELTGCDCVPLDCTVSVRRDLPIVGSVEATSRAGPVGEAEGEDESGYGAESAR